MQYMSYSIESLCGGAANVLNKFMADPQVHKLLHPKVAAAIARAIIQDEVKTNARGDIEPKIREAVDMYVLTNGAYEDLSTQSERDNWTDGMDDVIEKVLEPYEKALTADFMGRECIDTRFHTTVPPGDEDETAKLAKRFADQVWKSLIALGVTDPETGLWSLQERSSNQILTAAGILISDLSDLLQDAPDTATEAKEESTSMHTLESVMNKIHLYFGGTVDPSVVEPLFDNAIDSDAGLSASGMAGLGCTPDEAAPLKAHVKLLTADKKPAETLVDVLMDGPYEVPASVETEDDEEAAEAAALAELMGTAVPSPLAPPPPPAATTMGAPPPAPTPRPRNPGPGSTAVNVLPAEAFQLLRAHVKAKDEDIATGIGVSRQTFINYGKKSSFVPTAANKAFLLTQVNTALEGLTQAKALIEATEAK